MFWCFSVDVPLCFCHDVLWELDFFPKKICVCNLLAHRDHLLALHIAPVAVAEPLYCQGSLSFFAFLWLDPVIAVCHPSYYSLSQIGFPYHEKKTATTYDTLRRGFSDFSDRRPHDEPSWFNSTSQSLFCEMFCTSSPKVVWSEKRRWPWCHLSGFLVWKGFPLFFVDFSPHQFTSWTRVPVAFLMPPSCSCRVWLQQVWSVLDPRQFRNRKNSGTRYLV